jgi:hypothetical protein
MQAHSAYTYIEATVALRLFRNYLRFLLKTYYKESGKYLIPG